MNKEGNKSAFPVPSGYADEGLSKREHIAAMAMQGLLSKYSLNTPEDQKTIASLSIELADSLLDELES